MIGHFLVNAAMLFDSVNRLDAKAKKIKEETLPSSGGGKNKPGYDPSQDRGKDGRWVETNAEAKKGVTKEDKLPTAKAFKDADIKLMTANARKGREIGTVEIEGKSYFVKGNVSKETLQKEEGAYEVAKAMGVADLVVPVKAYTIKGKEYVVSPNLGKESSPAEKIQALKNNKEDAARALLFDYLTNQQDRNLGNVFATSDGKFKLIDNEDTFEVNKRTDIKSHQYAHDNDLKKAFAKGMLANKADFAETVIPEKSIQAVFKNADKIYKVLNSRKELNATIFRTRFQNLQKVYRPNETTFGDLFGDV